VIVTKTRFHPRLALKKFPDETWALAEADYMAGATAREVSAKYGMAMHTLYVHVRAGGKRKKDGRAPPRSLSESDVAGLIREIIAEGCAGAADRLLARAEAAGARKLGRDRIGRDRAGGERSKTDTFGPRKLRKRVHHAEELWEQMRRDYEMGDYTPSGSGSRARRFIISSSKSLSRAWSRRPALFFKTSVFS